MQGVSILLHLLAWSEKLTAVSLLSACWYVLGEVMKELGANVSAPSRYHLLALSFFLRRPLLLPSAPEHVVHGRHLRGLYSPA